MRMKSKSMDVLERKKKNQDPKPALTSRNVDVISQLHAEPKVSSHLASTNVMMQTPQEIPETFRNLAIKGSKMRLAFNSGEQESEVNKDKEKLIHSERASHKIHKRSPSFEQLNSARAHSGNKQNFNKNFENSENGESTKNSSSKKELFSSWSTTNTPTTSISRTNQKAQSRNPLSNQVSIQDSGSKNSTEIQDKQMSQYEKLISSQKKSSPNILNYAEQRQDVKAKLEGFFSDGGGPTFWQDLKSLYQAKRKENAKIVREGSKGEFSTHNQGRRPFSSYGSQQTADESPNEKFSTGGQLTNPNHFSSQKQLLSGHSAFTNLTEKTASQSSLNSKQFKSTNFPSSTRSAADHQDWRDENTPHIAQEDAEYFKDILSEKYEIVAGLMKNGMLDQLKANPNAKFLTLRNQVQKIHRENGLLDRTSRSQKGSARMESENAKTAETNSNNLYTERHAAPQQGEKNLRDIFEQTKNVLNAYKMKERQWKIEKTLLLKEIQHLRGQMSATK